MPLLLPTLLLSVMLATSLALAADAGDAASSTAPAGVDGATAFAADLYTHLAAATPPGKNLFFSPASIRIALAMTSTGARGATAAQMAAVLHLADDASEQNANRLFLALAQGSDLPDSAYQLSIANGLWVQSGYAIQPTFESKLRQDFAAQLQRADFAAAPDAARTHINDWVQQQTHDRIKDLLPAGSIATITRLVLANAVYFKGSWQDPFPEQATRPGPFHLDASQSASVPFMHREHATLNYSETDQYQAVELPYQGGAMSMLLVVPKAVDGLAAVEKSLEDAHLQQWPPMLQPHTVTLSMPRFTMSSQLALAPTLSAMGMADAFDPKRADFTGIATPQQQQGEPPLVINQVYHQAYVAVGEKGTEAAAATGVSMFAGAAMIRDRNVAIVTADRPFLFLIRGDGGTLLFMGRVSDPR